VTTINREFSERLIVAQAERNISSVDLAAVLEVTPALVYKWRCGALPATRHHRDLAAALDVDRAWLLRGEHDATLDAAEAEDAARAAVVALASAASSCARPGRLLGAAVARLQAAIERLDDEDQIEAWGLVLGEEVLP
jgi:hypothetical protein